MDIVNPRKRTCGSPKVLFVTLEKELAKLFFEGAEAIVRFMSRKRHPIARFAERSAQVAELVDAYVSGAYVARRAGSSPVLGTTK